MKLLKDYLKANYHTIIIENSPNIVKDVQKTIQSLSIKTKKKAVRIFFTYLGHGEYDNTVDADFEDGEFDVKSVPMDYLINILGGRERKDEVIHSIVRHLCALNPGVDFLCMFDTCREYTTRGGMTATVPVKGVEVEQRFNLKKDESCR